MTKEKKKAAFYVFSQGKDSKLETCILPKDNDRFFMKFKGEWFDIIRVKSEPAAEVQPQEEGA